MEMAWARHPILTTPSVRAELVEVLFCFFGVRTKEGQPFDKLRANGCGAM